MIGISALHKICVLIGVLVPAHFVLWLGCEDQHNLCYNGDLRFTWSLLWMWYDALHKLCYSWDVRLNTTCVRFVIWGSIQLAFMIELFQTMLISQGGRSRPQTDFLYTAAIIDWTHWRPPPALHQWSPVLSCKTETLLQHWYTDVVFQLYNTEAVL